MGRPTLKRLRPRSDACHVGRVVVIFAAVAVTLATAHRADAKIYYVSPTGSDAASGTIASPWRTVRRVDNSSAGAGDTVLFQGGATFSDATLMPPRGGTDAAPVTFSSYGSGQATLTRGAWLDGTSHVRITALTVDGGNAAGSAGVSSAHGGSGTTDVVVSDCKLVNVEIGVSLANRGDANWVVRNTLIQHTADSGIISVAHDSTFDHDTILDSGLSSTITWGKHGIYAKGPNETITNNTISGFSADGVSVRYRNAVVANNIISTGGIGIAWFQDDPLAGLTKITGNTIAATRSSGIYISPDDAAGATRESFQISGNTITSTTGSGMDIATTSGSLSVTGNTLAATLDPPLSVKQSLGPYSVANNVVETSSATTRHSTRR